MPQTPTSAALTEGGLNGTTAAQGPGSPEVHDGLTEAPQDLPSALIRTSHSSFSTFLTCPEMWRQERLLKREQLPMWAGVGGSAVHTTTESWDLFGLGYTGFGALGPDFSWQEQFANNFHRLIAEEEEKTGVPNAKWKIANKGTEDYQWWLENGPIFAKSWGDWRQRSTQWEIWTTPDGVPAIELEFLVDFGGIPVKGYIDRVMVKTDGSELMAVDLKAGRFIPETTDQLLLYAAALEIQYGIRPELGGYFDNRKGRLIYPERMDVETAEDTIERIGWFMAQANAGEFLARPGRQCINFCSVSQHCASAKRLTQGLRSKLPKP